MKPFSPAVMADRRPPWQNPALLRQVALATGALLLLYGVLVVIAALGGPRIGTPFLPLPGGGPDPASPVAGLEPGQPTQNIPAIPRGTTPTPTTAVTPPATPLPSATIPGGGSTVTVPVSGVTTPCPTPIPGKPATQIVEQFVPTTPVVTKTPPVRPTTTPPSANKPTVEPPTTPPPTSTTPSTPPPTTPDDPEPPNQGLGGLLGNLLDKLGL